MIQVLSSLSWVLLWALTIGTTISTFDSIWNDRDLDTLGSVDFLLAPLGWGIIVVFWFN